MILILNTPSSTMPNLFDHLPEITRFCCLFGLVVINGLQYYVVHEGCADRSVLFFNFSAGVYFAFIHRWAAATTKVVPN